MHFHFPSQATCHAIPQNLDFIALLTFGEDYTTADYEALHYVIFSILPLLPLFSEQTFSFTLHSQEPKM
jgi:hypothetical protein